MLHCVFGLEVGRHIADVLIIYSLFLYSDNIEKWENVRKRQRNERRGEKGW
jgi:hypothetical protein